MKLLFLFWVLTKSLEFAFDEYQLHTGVDFELNFDQTNATLTNKLCIVVFLDNIDMCEGLDCGMELSTSVGSRVAYVIPKRKFIRFAHITPLLTFPKTKLTLLYESGHFRAEPIVHVFGECSMTDFTKFLP